MFEKAGLFREGVRSGEDLDMWLRAACHFPVAFFNEPLADIHADEPDPERAHRTYAFSMDYSLWYDYPYRPYFSLWRYVNNELYNGSYRLLTMKFYRLAFANLRRCRGPLLLHLLLWTLFAAPKLGKSAFRRLQEKVWHK